MNGRVATRFEIGHDREGLIETAQTFAEAREIAENWIAGPNGYDDAEAGVLIYDAMARSNQPCKWRILQNSWHIVCDKAR